MSTDHWTTRRDDPRTQEGLKVKCPMVTCLAKPGDECKGTVGLVHQSRVPADVLGVKK